MDIKSSWSSCTFELEDIEIIDHKNEYEELPEKWYCDQCSLFFLDKDKLDEHKKKHVMQEVVKCKYCNKTISHSGLNKESYSNRKCETCEYKCSKCPQRFLRLSSLVNHEKKHSTPKKKRTTSNTKKLNGIPPENVSVSKALKRKRIETDDSEEQFKGLKSKKSGSKKKQNSQVRIQGLLDGGEDSSFKSSKRLSFKVSKSAEEDNYSADPPVMSKRLSLKTNKLLEENSSGAKVKQNSQFSGKTQAVSPTMNTSVSDNVVNYKPFSCHLCGDTFASDCALLDHIKTHGENAAKSFKCKFCGDEFDDIYKMQYHLAICPLAEDELESSLKQAIPPNTPTTFFGGTSSSRKRGRPKKTAELPSDQESSPYSNKRGNMRKRKSEMLENNEVLQNDDVPSLPKQSKNQSNKPFSGPDSNRVGEEKLNDSFPSDATVVTKEMEPDEDRKKVHKCPFPRCDFKFTREKALLCHMRNHSDDFDDSLKCHKCDIPFDDIQTLRLHINMCKGLKEEKDDDFNRARCYDSSPNRTFQRTKKDFVCNQCGKSYQSQDKLNRHLVSCCSKFVCRICKDDFLNQPLLDEHFASKHPPYTAYHCYICEEDFISELFLQIHQTDEHGQNLNTKHVQDHVEETIPLYPERRVSETILDTDSAITKHTEKINTIETGQTTSTSGRCTNTKFNSSVTVETKSTARKINRLFWCPICLQSFDKRDDMRFHFREKHVVTNSSTYCCEICGIKMPFVEMMCFHLEVHSSNLLSVNRFSKLIAYMKQNRVGRVQKSEVEIKCEKVSEDETSQYKQIIDVDCLKIPKKNTNRSSKRAFTLNKMVKNKSKPWTKSKSKNSHQICHQNSTVFNPDLVKDYEFPIESERKSKKTFNLNSQNKIQGPVEHVLGIKNSNEKNKPWKKTLYEINSAKPTRPLRSRVKVNYSLREKTGKNCGRQKVKRGNFSSKETFDETVILNDESDINVGRVDPKVLKSKEVVAEKMYSIIKRKRISRKIQQRKALSSSSKKYSYDSCLGTDIKTSSQVEELVEKVFYPGNCSKTKPSQNDSKTKEVLGLTTEENKDVSDNSREFQNRLKINKSRRSLCSRSKISNKCSRLKIKNEINIEQPSEENFNQLGNCATTKPLSVLSEGENNIVVLLDGTGKVKLNSDFSSEYEEKSVQLMTKIAEQDSLDLSGEQSIDITGGSSEQNISKSLHLKDSVVLPVNGITVEQLPEEESKKPLTQDISNKVPVKEDSRVLTSDIKESSISAEEVSRESRSGIGKSAVPAAEESRESISGIGKSSAPAEEESRELTSGIRESSVPLEEEPRELTSDIRGFSVPVEEKSRESTSGLGESEGICCKMCPEIFYNQDEFFEHLSKHI